MSLFKIAVCGQKEALEKLPPLLHWHRILRFMDLRYWLSTLIHKVILDLF